MGKVIKTLLVSFLFVCAVTMAGNQALAITLSFDPSDSYIGVGDLIGINIIISSLEDVNLAEFSMHVNYDDSILLFDSYDLGTTLTDPVWGQDDWSTGDIGGGSIHLSEVSWLGDFTNQPDSFILSTIYFIGNVVGISPLSFSDVILGDEWGDSLTDVELGKGSISAVPEPATLILLATGMLGMGVFGRKRKRHRK